MSDISINLLPSAAWPMVIQAPVHEQSCKRSATWIITYISNPTQHNFFGGPAWSILQCHVQISAVLFYDSMCVVTTTEFPLPSW